MLERKLEHYYFVLKSWKNSSFFKIIDFVNGLFEVVIQIIQWIHGSSLKNECVLCLT